MTARRQDLQRFLDCTERSIRARAASGSPEAMACERIFAALRRAPGKAADVTPARLPVCSAVSRGLALARVAGAETAALGEAVNALESSLRWHRRSTAREGDEPFFSGHANAMVVGAGGLEDRADVQIGLSCMAPDVIYPDHQHPPEEVYVSLAGGQWRNADVAWREPGAGGLFYNPPGIIHAMRTGNEPLLAIWCLWVG